MSIQASIVFILFQLYFVYDIILPLFLEIYARFSGAGTIYLGGGGQKC